MHPSKPWQLRAIGTDADPYTGESMAFYDGYSATAKWYSRHYLAIDQLTVAPMIENYRTGLLWKLFMSCPEIQQGLQALGITYTPEN